MDQAVCTADGFLTKKALTNCYCSLSKLTIPPDILADKFALWERILKADSFFAILKICVIIAWKISQSFRRLLQRLPLQLVFISTSKSCFPIRKDEMRKISYGTY